MQFDTPGRTKLIELHLGPSEIARKLGTDPDGKPVNPSLVSRWLSGTSRPDDVYKAILASIGYANADD